MNFPRYWAKGSYTGQTRDGEQITRSAFGWSSESHSEAEELGRVRAKNVVERGIGSDKRKDYEYGLSPFREEVIETLELDGNEIAVVSRNRYGSLVLNSANVMFVDIDFPRVAPTGLWDTILWHFSQQRRDKRRRIVEEISYESVKEWYRKHPVKSFRLYRTHSGLRLLLTDKLYDPMGDESKEILASLGSDPLYRALTERQGCYRARLSPKPWRCNIARPPSTFPWGSAEDEKEYRAWETRYLKESKRFSTCFLLKEYGERSGDPVIGQIVNCHDTFTIGTSLPLA